MTEKVEVLRVNNPARAVKDVTVKTETYAKPDKSYIDIFLDILQDINKRAGSAQDDHVMCALLLLWALSAAEQYFRSTISFLANICPVSKDALRDQTIVVGALLYHGEKEPVLGILDSTNFSDSNTVKNRTLTLLNIEVTKNSELKISLDLYEKVCQIRHSIIHSQSIIGYGNFRKLSEANSLKEKSILKFDALSLQTNLQILDNLIRNYNNYVFEEMISKWINSTLNIFKGTWEDDGLIFSIILKGMLCTSDGIENIEDAEKIYIKYLKDNALKAFEGRKNK